MPFVLASVALFSLELSMIFCSYFLIESALNSNHWLIVYVNQSASEIICDSEFDFKFVRRKSHSLEDPCSNPNDYEPLFEIEKNELSITFYGQNSLQLYLTISNDNAFLSDLNIFEDFEKNKGKSTSHEVIIGFQQIVSIEYCALFSNSSIIFPQNNDNEMDTNVICESIASALDERSFVLATNSPTNWNKLQLILEECGLHPTIVLLRSNHQGRQCTIDRVNWFYSDVVSRDSANACKRRSPIYCLSDFIDSIGECWPTKSQDSTAFCSVYTSPVNSGNDEQIVTLSHLGLDNILHRRIVPSSPTPRNARDPVYSMFSDLLITLRAFQASMVKKLIVKSMWTRLAFRSVFRSSEIRRVEIEDIRCNSDRTVAWANLILNDSYTGVSTRSLFTLLQQCCLTAFASNDIFCMSQIHSLEQKISNFSQTLCDHNVNIYFNQLRINQLNSLKGILQLLRDKRPSNEYFGSQLSLLSDLQFDQPAGVRAGHEISVAEADVHVLIVVFSHQIPFAQEKVNQWKKGCLIPTCQLFIHYAILAVDLMNCHQDKPAHDSLCSIPSMHIALLKVREWVSAISAPKDLIYLLIGIDGLNAFPQPAQFFPNTLDQIPGLIPATEYGSAPLYRLHSPLLVARSCRHNCFRSDDISTQMEVDFSAIVGTAAAWLQMIAAIKLNPLHALGQKGLLVTLRQFLFSYPLFLQLDGVKEVNAFHCVGHEKEISASSYNKDKFDFNSSEFQSFNESLHSILHQKVFDKSDGAVDISVLSMMADRMNHDWQQREWHLVAYVSYQCFRYIYYSPQNANLTNALPLNTGVTNDIVDSFDYISQAYLYHMTRNLAKAMHSYDWSKLNMLHDQLLWISQRVLAFCSLNTQNLARHCNNPSGFKAALFAALAATQQELGIHEQALNSLLESVPIATLDQVHHWQIQWSRQKSEMLNRIVAPGLEFDEHESYRITTHFVTVASEENEGLSNLILTGKLSGVDLKVLGLGLPYSGYGDKIRYYSQYLQSSEIEDEHIVVLIDAYDVLLFPAVHKIPKILLDSPSPILTCSEYGHYPEHTAAHAYYQESHHVSDFVAKPKFINSGCIVGRADQLRVVIASLLSTVATIDDDQQALIRYHLSHPGMIAVDSENQFSLTGYRESYPGRVPFVTISPTFKLSIFRGDREISNIGILHCNNMRSNSLYQRILAEIKAITAHYFSGLDAQDNLKALKLMWTHSPTDVMSFIQQSMSIQRNATSFGGENDASEFIMRELADLMQ